MKLNYLDLFANPGPVQMFWPGPGELDGHYWFRARFQSFKSEGPMIWFDKFPVLKRTEKGVWLDTAGWLAADAKPRFVLNDSKKAFAHSTPEAAVRGLLHRRKSYVRRLKNELGVAHDQLAAFERAISLKMNTLGG